MKSRLVLDYEAIQDNAFWKAFQTKVSEMVAWSLRQGVSISPDSIQGLWKLAQNQGFHAALRSVLGLPDLIMKVHQPTAEEPDKEL